MAIFDISRAHFMAPMDREACIEFPEEDKLPGWSWSGFAPEINVRISYSKCKLDERLASHT